jgi:hypothetical protein
MVSLLYGARWTFFMRYYFCLVSSGLDRYPDLGYVGIRIDFIWLKSSHFLLYPQAE